jgi:hypothetical protein
MRMRTVPSRDQKQAGRCSISRCLIPSASRHCADDREVCALLESERNDMRYVCVGRSFGLLAISLTAMLGASGVARGETSTPPTAAPTAPASAAKDAPPAATPAPAEAKTSGVLLGAKVGGILPFSGLGANVTGGIEVGYAFGPFAVALAADYQAPKSHDTASDPRLTTTSYSWHITEQELDLMPLFLYRLQSLGAVVPFVGIGPRIYLLKSTVRSNDQTPAMSETTEKSTKLGFGIPLGIELKLGPGAALAELLFQYGKIDHTATGDSNVGSASLSLGYRIVL